MLDSSFRHRDWVSKVGSRRVRTPAGVKFFNKPIGTLITEAEYQHGRQRMRLINAGKPDPGPMQAPHKPGTAVQGHHDEVAGSGADMRNKMWFKDTEVSPKRLTGADMKRHRQVAIVEAKKDYPRTARANMGKKMTFVYLGRRGNDRRVTDMRMISGTLVQSSLPDFYTLQTPKGKISVRYSHLTYMIPGA